MKNKRTVTEIEDLYGVKVKAFVNPKIIDATKIPGANIPDAYVWNVTDQTTKGYFFPMETSQIVGTVIAQIKYSNGREFVVLDTPKGIIIIEWANFVIQLLPLISILIEKIRDLFRSIKPLPPTEKFGFFGRHQLEREANFLPGYLFRYDCDQIHVIPTGIIEVDAFNQEKQ